MKTLCIAEKIQKNIEEHYRYEGRYYPPKSDDLIEHLQYGRIDRTVGHGENHAGFEISYDGSLAVFKYKDSSGLIVTPSGISTIGGLVL